MPPSSWSLDTVLFGNPLLRWGITLLVAVVLFFALGLARRLLSGRLAAREDSRRFRPHHLLGALLSKTHTWFLLVVSLFVATLFLEIEPSIRTRLEQVFVVLLFLQAAMWGNAIIAFFADLYGRRQDLDGGRRTSLAALTFMARVVLYSLLALVVLETVGIDVTALIAGLGVGSIAVALAVQGILGDLFASLSIVFDKPFEIGDFIVVDDLSGTVENIGLRTTRLRSLTGEQLVFSNNDLLASRIHNYKRMAERRIVFPLRIEYGTPEEKLERIPELIRSAIESMDDTRFDRSHFKGFGEWSLDFETVYYVLSSDYTMFMDIQQRLNLEVYRQLEHMDVNVAVPRQMVTVESTPPPS